MLKLMNSLRQKSCSICGESFGCGAENSAENSAGNAGAMCWCEDLPRVEVVEGLDCCCPKCLAQIAEEQRQTVGDTSAPPQLIEGIDYYLEGNSLVFTASYHLRRGYCCDSGCRHCPYGKTLERVERSAQNEPGSHPLRFLSKPSNTATQFSKKTE
jgi:hypothetical protein